MSTVRGTQFTSGLEIEASAYFGSNREDDHSSMTIHTVAIDDWEEFVDWVKEEVVSCGHDPHIMLEHMSEAVKEMSE